MGRVRFRMEELCIELLLPREIMQSSAQSMGRPKIVLMVTSFPKAKEKSDRATSKVVIGGLGRG
jgi:hypothetical protein